MEELDRRLFSMEEKIKELENDKEKTMGLVESINSDSMFVDSMIEFYRYPEKYTKRYNKLRMKYYKILENNRAYISVERNGRIEQIERDVEQMIYINELTEEYIKKQGDEIDFVCMNMENTNVNTYRTLSELETQRAYVKRKMRVWRFLGIISLSVVGVLFFIHKML